MRTPCTACQFCVEAGTSANVNKGSNCIWYGTYINYDNLGCIEHPLRDICRAEKDGDNFVMRMKDITPLDYAKYKQANDTLKDTLNHKFLALGFSAFALVISLIALFNKVS